MKTIMHNGVVRRLPDPIAALFVGRGEAIYLEGGAAVDSVPVVTVEYPLVEPVVSNVLETKVKVTAICPTYNRRKYLTQSINCFLAQTYTDSELLIVDDSTLPVKDLVPQHHRIRYIQLPSCVTPGVSLGAKRNFCCEQAKGELIVHWDDDDWQAPDRIEHQVALLEQNPDKVLLTYYNILYWNEAGQFACRCYPTSINDHHGATYCYRKSFWHKNRFTGGGGEDTRFAQLVDRVGGKLEANAREHMVVRAHGRVETPDARGNTCSTEPSMGCHRIPRVPTAQVPPAFFESMSKNTCGLADAVLGVVKNYGWQHLSAYAVSLARCGFKGEKLLFVENIEKPARQRLEALGFTLIDFQSLPPKNGRFYYYLEFGRIRFLPVIDFLKKNPGRFRNIIWTDVRDLIFQADPSAWLANHMGQNRIIGAGEGWRIKDEKQYNDRWLKIVAPQDYERIREFEVCCSGTFAGDAIAMLGLFEKIYELHCAAVDEQAADQGMFNYIVRTRPYSDAFYVSTTQDGFVSTWWPNKKSQSTLAPAGSPGTYHVPLIPNYKPPVWDRTTGLIYTPGARVPFCIVHQYDRDSELKRVIEAKYA